MTTAAQLLKAREEAIAEDEKKANAGYSQALKDIKDFVIVIDTNVLCKACGNNSSLRKKISKIVGQNTPIICTTVYWEFLRNCSLDKFRERMQYFERSGYTRIENEDHETEDMYVTLWMTYLVALKKDPKRMAKIKVPDLKIASFCVFHKYDRILTEDHSGDFPPELFDDQPFYLGNGVTIRLKTFNRAKAGECWQEALDGDIEVSTVEWR